MSEIESYDINFLKLLNFVTALFHLLLKIPNFPSD